MGLIRGFLEERSDRVKGWVLATGAAFALSASAERTIEWPAYGGAPGGGHYSRADQIHKGNVTGLRQAWIHRSGDFRAAAQDVAEGADAASPARRPTSFMVTPIMVRGTLYYCTPFNRVFALDPATGQERWMFDPEVGAEASHVTNCRGVSSWLDPANPDGVCGHRIVLGTLDSRLFAIDGRTGERCADFGAGGEVDLKAGLTEHTGFEYGVTSAPAIVGDLIVTGAYVLDGRRTGVPSGVVRAYSVRTGEFAWGWNPVHPDHVQRNADGSFVAGTTNAWSTISVDEQRGLVIVPTGNSSPDYYGGHRDGHLDYYSSSVVALRARTGEVAWHYQTVHHDIWDYDVPAQPTLVDVTVEGRTRPAVVQVTKMGLTFVLDVETGKPLHPVEERPVPQDGAVPGEYLSPTQPFPVKPEPLHQLGISPDDAWGFTFWDKGDCRDQLEALTTGPIYTPPTTRGTVLYPGYLGGNNWGAPAVDPDRQIMIANTKHMPFALRLVEREDCDARVFWQQDGTPYCAILAPVVSSLGAPCTSPPWATLAAVDLAGGDILWQVPVGNLRNMLPWPLHNLITGVLEMGGPTATAGGLVFFAATTDGYLRAHDIDSGAVLWEAELPSSGNAVPMTYMVGGRQFVVIAAGGHFTSPAPAGDALVAFSLP